MNLAEKQEREKLADSKEKLRRNLKDIEIVLSKYKNDVHCQKMYLGEARRDMDFIEKIAARQSIEYVQMAEDQVFERKNKIEKLLSSPYFGRFDFQEEGESEANSVYVGIHNFSDYSDKKPVIHDWRAPISSMFYDYEIGSAQYEAPSGKVTGEVRLKRQFRIKDGEMEFMIESEVNIVDEVLQKELSRTSDDSMKNIVATIQRDQNTIIRNENAKTLIIQGVAGSGKTSIALHRIAFLLYRFKDTLKSEDILIISPNRVFGDYISNVLPELGEESVEEVQMEALASELLKRECKFQTFFEQTAQLLEKEDENLKKRTQEKATIKFLSKLDEYSEYVKNNVFVSKDTWIGRSLVPAWFFDETFRQGSRFPVKKCVARIAEMAEKKIALYYDHELNSREKQKLKEEIGSMHKGNSLMDTYRGFFSWLGRPELFNLEKNSKFEYADVFPLIYLKIKLEEKIVISKKPKHLLIDEMQDHTPVQYAVIDKLFNCNKTILGDASQSVNPYSSSNTRTISDAFEGSSCVKLNKTYRSTCEIMNFAQRVSSNPELEVIERHGEEPRIIETKNKTEECNKVIEICKEFLRSDYNTMGIICKTQKQADDLSNILRKKNIKLNLLTAESSNFNNGIVICTAYMAKGLEFDQVIVFDVSDENYNSEMDRGLLYVACTRAMHRLFLVYTKKLTSLVSS